MSFLRSERGSAAAELVVLVVPIMVVVSFAVFAGRSSATHQDVTSASRDAARAAAVRQSGAQAVLDAEGAASAVLERRSVSCPTFEVEVRFFAADNAQVADPAPGGRVEVTVTCELGVADVVPFGVPGSRTVSSTSSAVVDLYRGGDR